MIQMIRKLKYATLMDGSANVVWQGSKWMASGDEWREYGEDEASTRNVEMIKLRVSKLTEEDDVFGRKMQAEIMPY